MARRLKCVGGADGDCLRAANGASDRRTNGASAIVRGELAIRAAVAKPELLGGWWLAGDVLLCSIYRGYLLRCGAGGVTRRLS